MASTSIFKFLEPEETPPASIEPVKPLQFCVHPLIAIEHYIALKNDTDLNNDEYPRYELFDDIYFSFGANRDTGGVNSTLMKIKDVDIPNYEELRELVNKTVEHYRTEFAMQALHGAHTSEWSKNTAKVLHDMDQYRIDPNDLQLICKLVPFYNFESQIAEMSQHCKSLVDANAGNIRKKFKKLTFIKKLKPQTRRDRGRTAYFFRTQSGHLLRVDLDHNMSSAVDTILNLSDTFSIDINVKPRTMYSENFTYFVANQINEVGV